MYSGWGTGTGVTRLVKGAFEPLKLSHLDQAEYAFDFYEQTGQKLLWLATDRGLVRYRLDTAGVAPDWPQGWTSF